MYNYEDAWRTLGSGDIDEMGLEVENQHERLDDWGASPPTLEAQDPFADYKVDDLHLSRLGLTLSASRPSPLPAGGRGSSTSSSYVESPTAFSPGSSCASPKQSSIWAPLASTSTYVGESAGTPSLVKSPKQRKGKTFVCEQERCGKAFSKPIALRRHLMAHTGDRPYACPLEGCGKTFVQASALKVHQRTHTGARPYVCEVKECRKFFADPSCLARHRRVHTGLKPYKCTVTGCNGAFTRQTTLDRHLGSHKIEIETAMPDTLDAVIPAMPDQWKFGDPPLIPLDFLFPPDLFPLPDLVLPPAQPFDILEQSEQASQTTCIAA